MAHRFKVGDKIRFKTDKKELHADIGGGFPSFSDVHTVESVEPYHRAWSDQTQTVCIEGYRVDCEHTMRGIGGDWFEKVKP